MTKNKILIFLGVLLVIAFSYAYVTKPTSKAVAPSNGKVGAVTGPELFYPSWTVNNVRHVYAQAVLNTATTTPCALKSPAATSSMIYADIQYATGTTTDTVVVTLANAATPFATTTGQYTWSLTAGGGATEVWNGTTTSSVAKGQILPNTYEVFGAAGTVPGGTTNLTGTCQAEFITDTK